MRLISLILAISLQLKPLTKILTRAEYLAMSCQDNTFDSIVNTGKAEEMLELVCHNVREGIAVLWPVECA